MGAILDALTPPHPGPLPLGEGTRGSSPERREARDEEVRLPSPAGRGAGGEGEITKRDIFHYVYAVLHDPAYRAKYEINLKREFPRIPFYDDFWQWAAWGARLMELHLGYEGVEAWPLERVERETKGNNKVTLKAVKPQERRSPDERRS